MFQQGPSDWTVTANAIATIVSALVALASAAFTARTYDQSRKDKAEELEYKRPKFKVSRNYVQ